MRRQCAHGGNDGRDLAVQSFALRLYALDLSALFADDEPIAVMLDFVDPWLTRRDFGGERG